MNVNHCAAYGRASTDKQEQSIAGQSDQLTAYAAANKLILSPDSLFLEDDTSGSINFADRPKGGELLRRFQLGHFTHLIVPRIDRLGRRALDVQNTIAKFHEIGATIHILNLGGWSFNTRSPVSGLIIAVFAWCAEMELESIRERVNQGLGRKQANGELCGSLCFGWDAVSTGETRTNKGGKVVVIKKLVPNEKEQDWLQNIHEWHVGGQTWYRIAQLLNQYQVPTKKAGEVQTFRGKRQGQGQAEVRSEVRLVRCRWTASKVQRLYESKTVQAWLIEQANGDASAAAA